MAKKCPFNDEPCIGNNCDYWTESGCLEIKRRKEMEKLHKEVGEAMRAIFKQKRPPFRPKPLPEVGVSPENGEPIEDSADLEYENIPLSKRINPKKPKKRGDK